MTGSDDFWRDQLRKHVAARRQRTERKFDTCKRMKPTFAALDAAGWNDWPEENQNKSQEEERVTKCPEVLMRK